MAEEQKKQEKNREDRQKEIAVERIVQVDLRQEDEKIEENKKQIVIDEISTQYVNFNLVHDTFLSVQNPRGEGYIVYYPQTRFLGVERILVWFVIDGNAYPLNGATRGVTPTLPWLREASDDVKIRSGLSVYIVDDDIMAIVMKSDSN